MSVECVFSVTSLPVLPHVHLVVCVPRRQGARHDAVLGRVTSSQFERRCQTAVNGQQILRVGVWAFIAWTSHGESIVY